VHGGYAGVPDDDLLRVPYARLLQAVRLASEDAAEAARDRYRQSAFVGWQVRSAVVGALGGGGNPPAFGEYLRQLGFDKEPVVTTSRERVSENVNRVRSAFAGGRMRKIASR